MPSLRSALTFLAAAASAANGAATPNGKKPNILFLMTDDQDIRLGSMEYMPNLQKELIGKGANFLEHHTTSAQCCPSRVTLLRGQAAHNTNVTSVFAPGGNYEKFRLSGQGDNYLPHWMKKAGYRNEYVGKFLNGVNLLNYDSPPPGWDYVETFIEPYQTTSNRVVMTANGEHPVAYLGYHQTDIMRAKALDRLEKLTSQDDPWMLMLSPTAPQVDDETGITVPCSRHDHLFPDAQAPRTPNFNPPDEIHLNNKVSWIRDLVRMNEGNVSWADFEFRNRVRSLVSIDEMLGDILEFLEDKGELENTYLIFTSDNGYHLGQHRMTVGKATPYIDDTNLPMVVRGPGVPAGVNSSLVSAHLDFAPTFLEIAGVEKADRPFFLDGRSLLEQWHGPAAEFEGHGGGSSREVLNVEYWGFGSVRVDDFQQNSPNNTYKTIRIIGDGIGWFYNVWCAEEQVELYNTVDDPFEMKNLAIDPDEETQRLMNRLNAMLLVTKSCEQTQCQNTWGAIAAAGNITGVTTLKGAMDPQYDDFFASIQKVNIAECLAAQSAANEVPFWPPGSDGIGELGLSSRNMTPALGFSVKMTVQLGNEKPEGGPEQRYATLEEIVKASRLLTDAELDPMQPRRIVGSGGI